MNDKVNTQTNPQDTAQKKAEEQKAKPLDQPKAEPVFPNNRAPSPEELAEINKKLATDSR